MRRHEANLETANSLPYEQQRPQTMTPTINRQEIRCQCQNNLGVRMRHRHRRCEEVYLQTLSQPHPPQSHPAMFHPQQVYPPISAQPPQPSTSHTQQFHPSQVGTPELSTQHPARSNSVPNVSSTGFNSYSRRRLFRPHHQMSHTRDRPHGVEVSALRSGTRVTELKKLFESDSIQPHCSVSKDIRLRFPSSFPHPIHPVQPSCSSHRSHFGVSARHADLYVQYAHSTHPALCTYPHAHFNHSDCPYEQHANPHPAHPPCAQPSRIQGSCSLYDCPWVYSRSTKEHVYEKVDQM